MCAAGTESPARLVDDLGLSSGQTQWVVDAYSLVFAGLLLTAGSLSDRYGRKRGPLLGLVLFGTGLPATAQRRQYGDGPRDRPVR